MAKTVPLGARLAYGLGDLLDLRAAQERARLLARPRRLYRGRGDRRRSLRLLSLDRPQPEAALRADGGLPVCHRAGRPARCAPTRSGRPRPTSICGSLADGEVQFRSPGMFVGYFREREKTREAMTEDGFVKTGDAGFFEPDGQLKIVDRAKDVGRLPNGQMFAPEIYREQAEVLPRHPRGGGDRRRARVRHRDDQHRTRLGRRLGRAQRRLLRLLSGSRRPPARVRDDRGACRRGQPRAEPRAGDGGGADPPLPHPAQGARRRRRRTHPDAEGAARLHRRALRAADRRALRAARARPRSPPKSPTRTGARASSPGRSRIVDMPPIRRRTEARAA